MAEQEHDDNPNAVTFRYAFRFDSGEEQIIDLSLDAKTLNLIDPVPTDEARQAALGFCQIDDCPRQDAKEPTCPAICGLDDMINRFAGHPPAEEVEVTVQAEARTYRKRATLQQAVTSLVGIFMVGSGCPVLGKLKPMARHHLPFATLEETQYRVISMYLLAQHFLAQRGQKPDWKLRNLVKIYKDIQAVNEHFVNRLSGTGGSAAASINALVILQAFSYAIAFSVDRDMLEELQLLFKAYFSAEPA